MRSKIPRIAAAAVMVAGTLGTAAALSDIGSAATVLSSAEAAYGTNHAEYLVKGEVVVDFGDGQFTEVALAITADSDSTAAAGVLRKRDYGPGYEDRYAGTVDCLTVVGDTAYISGVLTEASRPDTPVGSTFSMALTDGGLTGTDVISPFFLNPGFTCSAPVFEPEFVVTSGDVTIQLCEKLKRTGKCKLRGERP